MLSIAKIFTNIQIHYESYESVILWRNCQLPTRTTHSLIVIYFCVLHMWRCCCFPISDVCIQPLDFIATSTGIFYWIRWTIYVKLTTKLSRFLTLSLETFRWRNAFQCKTIQSQIFLHKTCYFSRCIFCCHLQWIRMLNTWEFLKNFLVGVFSH